MQTINKELINDFLKKRLLKNTNNNHGDFVLLQKALQDLQIKKIEKKI